jgi:hypothetical protein
MMTETVAAVSLHLISQNKRKAVARSSSGRAPQVIVDREDKGKRHGAEQTSDHGDC